MSVKLFPLDSPEDLVARGVSRSLILDKIGVDVGHNGSVYIRALRGIDRLAYQRQHITERIDKVVFQGLVDQYVAGDIDSAGLFLACGVNAQCRLGVCGVFEAAGFGDVYADVKTKAYLIRSERAKRTMIERYGASTVLGVPEFRKKFEDTMVERYGAKHALQVDTFKEKSKSTTRAHFGVDYAHQSAEVRAKSVATMRERYGFDYATQNPDVYAKVLATTKARYGVEHPLQSADCREKQRATNVAKYGASNVFQCAEIKAKAVDTLLRRYGVSVPMRSDEIKARFIATNQVRYGCDYPMQNAGVRAKADETCVLRYGAPFRHFLRVPSIREIFNETCRVRYGVDWPLSSAELREKACHTRDVRYGGRYTLQSAVLFERVQNTIRARYGVDYSGQIASARAKARETCLEKYGVEYATQRSDIRAKASATMMSRYGVPYAMLDESLVARMLATKDKNHTHNVSASEDLVYGRLVQVFGEQDVVRQYRSDFYPYRCDFYIRSRDMYIECNGYFSHWHHWFGSSEFDDITLSVLRDRLSDAYYDKLLRVWCGSDVAKRNTACKNQLNYVVFWGDVSEDADVWFSLGCPDGQDWDCEYSWLPARDLVYDGAWPAALSLSVKTVFSAVIMAQWSEFYRPSIEFWAGRFDDKWGTIQARLYVNRLKHIGKGPSELTNFEIMRGLCISGMVRGYSHFQYGGLLEFLDKYCPTSIYDPCAGWGERLLVCSQRGVSYLGVDINARLFAGYTRLVDQYALDNVSVICGDSSTLDLTHAHHDCVFTCPPYGGREIYTDVGSENFCHDDFIKWWADVVDHSVCADTCVFAYQIDQTNKSAMNEVLLLRGWRLDGQIPVAADKVNHMCRAKGVTVKKNFEEIQVFVR